MLQRENLVGFVLFCLFFVVGFLVCLFVVVALLLVFFVLFCFGFFFFLVAVAVLFVCCFNTHNSFSVTLSILVFFSDYSVFSL